MAAADFEIGAYRLRCSIEIRSEARSIVAVGRKQPSEQVACIVCVSELIEISLVFAAFFYSTPTVLYCLNIKEIKEIIKMPASAYSDAGELTRHNSLEDQRALQVALELSLLSFNDHHHQDANNSANSAGYTMDQIASLHYADEMRFLAKKSQNMTECVPVPSSEHVAEIVGRQGNAFASHQSAAMIVPIAAVAPLVCVCPVWWSTVFFGVALAAPGRWASIAGIFPPFALKTVEG